MLRVRVPWPLEFAGSSGTTACSGAAQIRLDCLQGGCSDGSGMSCSIRRVKVRGETEEVETEWVCCGGNQYQSRAGRGVRCTGSDGVGVGIGSSSGDGGAWQRRSV